MKFYKLPAMALLAFSLLFTAYAQRDSTIKKETVPARPILQCPMKCEGTKTYSKAGRCPECGMTLKRVLKKAPDPK